MIAELTRNHATVHNRDGNRYLAPFENKTAGLEITGGHFATPPFQESAVDEERVEGRGDILHVGPCFERGCGAWGVLCGKIKPEGQEAAKDSPEESVASEEGGLSGFGCHGRLRRFSGPHDHFPEEVEE